MLCRMPNLVHRWLIAEFSQFDLHGQLSTQLFLQPVAANLNESPRAYLDQQRNGTTDDEEMNCEIETFNGGRKEYAAAFRHRNGMSKDEEMKKKCRDL